MIAIISSNCDNMIILFIDFIRVFIVLQFWVVTDVWGVYDKATFHFVSNLLLETA